MDDDGGGPDGAVPATGDAVPPREADVVVIGGGLAGLTIACAFFEECPRLVLLEREALLGGVWRAVANAYSSANSSGPAYRLPVPQPRGKADRSTRDEILEDVAVAHRRLAAHVFLGTCANAVIAQGAASPARAHEAWSVYGSLSAHCAAQKRAFEVVGCGLVVLAVGGRLGLPRPSLLSPDAAGRALGVRVRRGLRDDCAAETWAGLRVAVVGFGNFALV